MAHKGSVEPVIQVNTIVGTGPQHVDSDTFRRDQEKDETLKTFWNKANTKEVSLTKGGCISFTVKRGLLFKSYENKRTGLVKEQLIVPENMRLLVMSNAHSGPLAGHKSIRRTRARVYSQFSWPGADKDIKMHCKTCDVCQRARYPGRAGKAELGRMDIITTPFTKVAVDIVGPMQMTNRKNRFILTLVDTATRWPEAVALKEISSETVIEALSTIFTRIGFPEEILSDNGPQFNSELYTQVNKFFGIKGIKTTPYHPNSNGMVERFNGSLKHMLRKLAANEPDDWDRFLGAALFAYREAPNESTRFSPYEIVFGRKMRGPMSILKHLFTDEGTNQDTRTVYEYLVDLRHRLKTTMELAHANDMVFKRKTKLKYDKTATPKHISVGDYVLVLRPKRINKLSLFWDGPYQVTKRSTKFNVTIQKGRKLKTYHINRVVKYHDRKFGEQPPKADGGSTHLLHGCLASVISEADFVGPGEAEVDKQMIPTISYTETHISKEIIFNQRLEPQQLNDLTCLVNEFSDIISDIPGKAKVEEFKIETTSDIPVTLRPYTVPFSLKANLDEEIRNMINLGIIEESTSSYSSPVVMVKKNDGSLRTCIDYRKLNSITKFDAEVIPDPEDIFVSLQAATIFSKIDLTKGFWQIPVHRDSRQFTAFRVPTGHYQFRYLPFGLKNSPSVFARVIRKLLKGIQNVVSYFDDICVYSTEWTEHLRVLKEVFMKLREVGLTAKPSKLILGFPSITFLGHVVGGGSQKPDPANIDKVLLLGTPRTKKEVRSLLGLANYYNKFIPHFATIVNPLTELLLKGKPTRVMWTPECECALRVIQCYLNKEPILKLPNLSKSFSLQTDASNVGIACCLMQTVDGILHPVKFLSRKLLPREQRFSVIERECLAIVWSTQKLSRYLYGKEFKLLCDHKPLAFLQSANYGNSRICRWALALQEFAFTVEHIKGTENFAADILSRVFYDK
ncbi:uncharacterized protein K02A2.6-like [Physella acuta]|uniref:uncharacterized protein K02A2.6-like n=1 Tax=Physella acuta TaxID=109671 RepID=UPI0027DD871D|nr:uncharacterized protein K02A2.6-like [Physella acuta]